MLLAAASLAACGNDVEVELVWGGPPEPNSAGIVSTDGFASFQENVDEHWERSAAMAAAEFLRLDERTVVRTTIDAKASSEGTGPQVVTVTLDGLLDDSVRAERWSLAFEPDGETYRLDDCAPRAALPAEPRAPELLGRRLRLAERFGE